nr:unnamed protein product [Callosobruchus analis]
MRNLWLLLLILPIVISFFENDPIEDEGEAEVEEVGTLEEEEEESKTTASPDADTTLLFVKPIFSGSSQMEIPAGLPVEFLVGFRNKGEEDFIVESLEASFRYPMDFSFYIQNFSGDWLPQDCHSQP